MSFLICTGKNGSYQIFMTFLGPGTTGTRNVGNRALMTRLAPETYPHFLAAIFLVSRLYDKKMFMSNFDNLSGAGPAKVENWTQMPTFGTPNIPTQFVMQFICFLLVQLKNDLVEFRRLFGPRYYRGEKS